MFRRLSCLMVAGISLTDDLREIFYQAAKLLAEKGRTSVPLKQDDCEGQLKTDFRTVCLGSLAGIRFEAVLETETGTGKAVFIIPEDVLWDESEEAEFAWRATPPPGRTAQTAWMN